MTRRPNVVVVITDDQGFGDLGCHGNPYIRTPEMDRLHAESVRLWDYHVAPTCSPTRAGLLTGHYANSTGVWHTIGGRSLLRRDERTLAEYLSEADYATGLFGKWHLGDSRPYRPQDRGFQEVVWHPGGTVGSTSDHWGNNYTDDSYATGGEPIPFPGYCTDVWFESAVDFIRRHRDEPFFCYIATNAPHSPHIAPAEFVDPYRELVETDPDAAQALGHPASDQMVKFYGMVGSIDHNLGVLRRTLEQAGIADDTILIFTTDNGSGGGLVCDPDGFVRHGFNAGMRGGKATQYEGGHRVPFFIHWPAGGLVGGRDVTALTANVDVVPTLLEFCGVEADPEAFHGRSLTPLLEAPDDSAALDWPDRAVVTDSQRVLDAVKGRLSCVMRGRWRLINGRELYDLETDPEQRTDIAGAHPHVVQRLRADYEDWWELVSPRAREEIPLVIDDRPTMLTAHDWRRDPGDERVVVVTGWLNDDARCVWNQSQVHAGPMHPGYWEIDVAAAGRYRVELRRWPREADLPITAGIPGTPLPYDDRISGGYGGGTAIPVRQAALRIGGEEHDRLVDPEATCAEFELALPAGPAHLEATFTTVDGDQVGAYYVYVEPAAD